MRQRSPLEAANGALAPREHRNGVYLTKMATCEYAGEKGYNCLDRPQAALPVKRSIEMLSKASPDSKAIAVSSCNDLHELQEAPRLVMCMQECIRNRWLGAK